MQLTPLYAAASWSHEHLLLHECSAHPRELAELLRRARARHHGVSTLQGRLQLTDNIKAVWGRIVSEGFVTRDGPGYVLTRQGEIRLEYLHDTQVVEPYLKQIRVLYGATAARQMRLEMT